MICEYSLLKWLINTKIVNDMVSKIIGYLLTQFVKFHLSLIIYYTTTTRYYLSNFLWGVLINVIFYFLTDNLYGYVMTHKDRIDIVSAYILENISEKKYNIWKKYLYFIFVAYCFHCLLIINIDNTFLALTITQSVLSTIVIDTINNNYHKKFYLKFKNYFSRKPIQKIHNIPIIFDNYDTKNTTEDKIPTPPKIDR